MIIDTNYNNGDVAQLGEHYTCTVGVVGSSPTISTWGRLGFDCWIFDIECK